MSWLFWYPPNTISNLTFNYHPLHHPFNLHIHQPIDSPSRSEVTLAHWALKHVICSENLPWTSEISVYFLQPLVRDSSEVRVCCCLAMSIGSRNYLNGTIHFFIFLIDYAPYSYPIQQPNTYSTKVPLKDASTCYDRLNYHQKLIYDILSLNC